MMRYKLTRELRKSIINSGYSFNELSKLSGFQVKNIFFKNISINEFHLKKLCGLLNINPTLKEIKFDYGRNLGSMAITAKIKPIKEGKKLAEFIGIMLGDGNLYRNQITISLDRRDKEYIDYIKHLCLQLFGIYLKIKFAKNTKEANLYCYNKNLASLLIKHGLKRGNKKQNGLGIPPWIKENSNYSKKCIKGLVDTDGCIYKCKREKQTYVKFTNHNVNLLDDFKELTKNLGYSFARANSTNVCLYRKNEVVNFIKDIKPFKIYRGCGLTWTNRC